MEKEILKKYIIAFNNWVFGFSLALWFIGLIGTLMMFDAPGSEKLWYLQIAFWTYVIYPIVVILSVILSKKHGSLWVSLAPVVNIVIFFGLLSVFWR